MLLGKYGPLVEYVLGVTLQVCSVVVSTLHY